MEKEESLQDWLKSLTKQELLIDIEGFDEELWGEALSDFIETPLKTRAMRKQEIKNSILEIPNSKEVNDVCDGFTLCMEREKEILESCDHDIFTKEMERFTNHVATKEIPKIDEGTTLAEAMNFPLEFLSCIQKIGIHFLKKSDFENASHVFKFLVEMAPNQAGAWFSLGQSQEALGNVEEAINAYINSLSLRLDDPWPCLLAANLASKHDPMKAKALLDLAKERISAKDDPKLFAEEIAFIEETLKKGV